ncbi:Fungal Zn(2)-Cys(6) binuclear cluster domain [Ceratobasidium sp. AG-Ba]|nr:Fungal Zn(2)-Cys(6) binuclear cluster domain [Ceratobasidium sp. AG-Ba]
MLGGRSKTGCLTCKNRRKKCDETRPTCERCRIARMECLGYSYLDNPVRKPRKPRTNRNTSTTAPSLGSTAMHLSSISSYPGTSTTHDSHEIVENQTGSDRWTAMPSHLSFYSHFDPLGDHPSLLGPPHSSQVDIPTAAPLQPSSDTAFSAHPQSTNDLPTQSHAQTPLVYPPAKSDAMSRLAKVNPYETGLLVSRRPPFGQALSILGSSEAYQMVSWGPNAVDDQHHMGSRTETRDESDTEDEDEDAEGVMEAVRPMLGLDRDVPSNSLPYILSSR